MTIANKKHESSSNLEYRFFKSIPYGTETEDEYREHFADCVSDMLFVELVDFYDDLDGLLEDLGDENEAQFMPELRKRVVDVLWGTLMDIDDPEDPLARAMPHAYNPHRNYGDAP